MSRDRRGPARPEAVLFLTPEAQEAIVLSLAASRGRRGFTADEVCKVLEWAEEAALNTVLLEMVVGRDLLLDVVNGEVAFCLSSQGQSKLRALLKDKGLLSMVSRLTPHGE